MQQTSRLPLKSINHFSLFHFPPTHTPPRLTRIGTRFAGKGGEGRGSEERGERRGGQDADADVRSITPADALTPAGVTSSQKELKKKFSTSTLRRKKGRETRGFRSFGSVGDTVTPCRRTGACYWDCSCIRVRRSNVILVRGGRQSRKAMQRQLRSGGGRQSGRGVRV